MNDTGDKAIFYMSAVFVLWLIADSFSVLFK